MTFKKNLLVAIDFSPATAELMNAALDYAKLLDAHLNLVYVIDLSESLPEEYFIDPSDKKQRQLIQERGIEIIIGKLTQLSKQYRGKVSISDKLLQGNIAKRINEEAMRLNSDFIMVGAKGHGCLENALIGSVTDKLIRIADKPVLVIPNSQT